MLSFPLRRIDLPPAMPAMPAMSTAEWSTAEWSEAEWPPLSLSASASEAAFSGCADDAGVPAEGLAKAGVFDGGSRQTAMAAHWRKRRVTRLV